MLARLQSATVFGVTASLVTVEVDVSFGLPAFAMVGLPDSSVRESRDRVRSAIRNSGFEFPAHRITVNLAPASLPKRGTSFDLAVAIGVVAAGGLMSRREFDELLVIGELSLNGAVHPTKGVLPVALLARARRLKLLTACRSIQEAAIVPGLDAGAVTSLGHAIQILDGRAAPEPPRPTLHTGPRTSSEHDMSEVHGQRLAKRALEVAAAGRHNVLMVGPPGTGKTMMAQRLSGLLPEATFAEAIETTSIHSVAGLVGAETPLVMTRPFRAPHHTVSHVALVGGGVDPHPGEVSLAHNGVLFLDEMPEFGRHALEALRQPLEEGVVRIGRAAGLAVFPARFLLVGAMNPCPCGYRGLAAKECRCTPHQLDRYHHRLSGPLRDRFDLVVPVAPLTPGELTTGPRGEPSRVIRERIVGARRRQKHRYRREALTTNADLRPGQLAAYCELGPDSARLLERAVARFNLSARGFDRVRKVARTIADLDAAARIDRAHVAEALSFRGTDLMAED